MHLSRKQLSLIHVAKTQLALTDEDYRAILLQVAGVTSSSDLDGTGFKSVLNHFERLGFSSNVKAPGGFGTRPGMASPAQVDLIRVLWKEYKGVETDDMTLGRWLERNWHVSSIRFLGYGDAQKAIGALKMMRARNFDKPKHSSRKGGENHAHH